MPSFKNSLYFSAAYYTVKWFSGTVNRLLFKPEEQTSRDELLEIRAPKKNIDAHLIFIDLGFDLKQDASLISNYFVWQTSENLTPDQVKAFLLSELNRGLELYYQSPHIDESTAPDLNKLLLIVGLSKISKGGAKYFQNLYDSFRSPVAFFRSLIDLCRFKSIQSQHDLIDKLLSKLIPETQTTTLLNTTMGIEFEFFGLGDVEIVGIIIDKIIKMRQTADGSIEPDDDSYGLEYTTPVLSTVHDLDRVLLVLDVLKAAGARTNSSCGLHFHLGINNFDSIPQQVDKVHYQLELIKNFLILYYRFAEPQFRGVLRPYNRYCANQEILPPPPQRDHGDGWFYLAIRQCSTFDELMDLVCPESRNYAVNLRSLLMFGTIEIRRQCQCGTGDGRKYGKNFRQYYGFCYK